MQKSAINVDNSRWMERSIFRYDFGELAAGKWRGCCGLITRRSLVQIQVAPFFISPRLSATYVAFPPNLFDLIFPSWGSSEGIANHNSEKVPTKSNKFLIILNFPHFPPISLNRSAFYLEKQSDFSSVVVIIYYLS